MRAASVCDGLVSHCLVDRLFNFLKNEFDLAVVVQIHRYMTATGEATE